MAKAFTISRGKNEGEYIRECLPKYQQQLKDMSKQIEAARK